MLEGSVMSAVLFENTDLCHITKWKHTEQLMHGVGEEKKFFLNLLLSLAGS